MLEKAAENNASEVCAKVLQLETTVCMERITKRGHKDEAKLKKARGSVQAEIIAYNAAGSVGEAYRELARKRRKRYIREY